MAEIIGVAASVAGLLSLSFQITETVHKLKARSAAVDQLPATITGVEKNLEFLANTLQWLQDTNQMFPLTTNVLPDGLLRTCQADYDAILKVLTVLESKLPVSGGRRARLKLPSGRGAGILEDIQRLGQLQQQACHHLTMTMSAATDNKISALTTHLMSQQLLANEDKPQDDSSALCIRPTGNANLESTVRAPRIAYCGVRHCHCSCHATTSASWGSWAIRYTPLSAMLRGCDYEGCNARGYQLSIRMHFLRLGIPLGVIVGGEITTGTAGYSIRPALRTQRIVRATSVGFAAIRKLAAGMITVEEAKHEFLQLHRSDHTLRMHVGPSGRTYLQELAIMTNTRWYKRNESDQTDLLRYLVQEINLDQGINTAEFLQSAMNRDYFVQETSLLDTVLELGYSFQGVEIPPSHLSLYSYAFPLYKDYLDRVLKHNDEFCGSHPLHRAVLDGNEVETKHWIARLSSTLDTVTNSLGQSPMHMALKPGSEGLLNILIDKAPNLIDNPDRWGLTPLMHAMSSGYMGSASCLIKNGASLSFRPLWMNRSLDFLEFAFMGRHQDRIWDIFDDILTAKSTTPADEWRRLFELYQKRAHGELEHIVRWRMHFWKVVFSEGLEYINLKFADDKTLGHLVSSPEIAQKLIQSGFTLLNHKDSRGEHCLISAVRQQATSVVEELLKLGADPHVRDRMGATCLGLSLNSFFWRWNCGYPHHILKDLQEGFRIVRALLALQVDAGARDDCDCPCSDHGHLASDVRDQIPQRLFLLVEYWSTLEDFGLLEEVKQGIISQLRQIRFLELGLKHRCECFSSGTPEDRPWDLIKDEQREETLELEMEQLQNSSIDTVKHCFRATMSQEMQTYEAERTATITEYKKEKEKEKRLIRNRLESFGVRCDNIQDVKLVVDTDNDQFLTGYEIKRTCQQEAQLTPHYDRLDSRESPQELFNQYQDYLAEMEADPSQVPVETKEDWVMIRKDWVRKISDAMGLEIVWETAMRE
ncbi:hypothetical protein OQA88_4428 [Cercophora sp. LCS_1]